MKDQDVKSSTISVRMCVLMCETMDVLRHSFMRMNGPIPGVLVLIKMCDYKSNSCIWKQVVYL